MTDTAPALAPPSELDRQLATLTPCEIVVGLPTYNNAATVPAIVAAVRAGLAAHFVGASAALVNVDAGSTDRTPQLLTEAGHALEHPVRPPTGRDLMDLWLTGTAIAEGFAVWEAWLGPRHVESRTRTTDLPTMLAQALGAVFTVMEQDEELWLGVAGSEPVSAVGGHAPPSATPATVSVDRMLGAFRRGLRDLIEIWRLVLAPEPLAGVLDLAARDALAYRVPA